MTARPPTLDRPAEAEGPEPPEVLFREVRRRRRRRWLAAGAVVSVLGAAGIGTAISMQAARHPTPTTHVSEPPRAAPGPPPCRPAQLALSATIAPGAGSSGGEILVYDDLRTHACTLSGYPAVTGVTATTGDTVAAHHEPKGYLGGVQGRTSADRVPLPVVLHGRGAVASSMVEYASMGTLQTVSARCRGVGHHPMRVEELHVVIDGGAARVVAVTAASPLVVCNGFSVNPYVPGSTGRWDPTAPTHTT